MTQCLILCGGLGTRMQAVTENAPKSLIPVCGQPFLHHQMAHLANEGISKVVLSIGHLGFMIRDFAGTGDQWGLNISYVDEGGNLLGTGGAVRLAVEEGLMNEGFFVLYGDSYLPISYPPVWKASGGGREPLMTVYENEGRFDQSNVIFENGRINRYEKGRKDAAEIGMHHIDYGLSVLTRDTVREFSPPDKSFDLSLIFAGLVAENRLKGYEVAQRFYEIGSPEGLAELAAYLSQNG